MSAPASASARAAARLVTTYGSRAFKSAERIVALATTPAEAAVWAVHERGATLFDASDGEALRTVALSSGADDAPVSAGALDADGQKLFVGRADGRLEAWDLAADRGLLARTSVAGGVSSATTTVPPVRVVVPSPDGLHVATWCEADDVVRLWAGTEPVGPARGARVVAFAPDCATFVVDQALRDVRTGRVLLRLVGETPARARCAAFAADGATLAVGGDDGRVALWDLAAQRVRWSAALPEATPGRPSRVLALFVAGDGVLAVTAHSVVALAGDDGRLLREGAFHATSPVLAERTGRLFGVAHGTRVAIFDLAAFAELAPRGHDGAVAAVAPSPRAPTVLTGGGTRLVLWHLESGEALREVDAGAPVHHVAFFSDGRRVAAATGSAVRVFDMATGAPVAATEPSGEVVAMATAPQGAFVAVGSRDDQLRLWDADRGADVWARGGAASSVAFAPDGGRILVAGEALEIADTMTGRVLATAPTTHRARFHAFLAGERALSAGGGDGLVLRALPAWTPQGIEARTLDDGSQHRRFSGAADAARLLAVSPDERLAATTVAGAPERGEATEACAVALWDVAGGALLERIELGAERPTAAAFGRDGALLVGTSTGVLLSFAVSPPPDRSHDRAPAASAAAAASAPLSVDVELLEPLSAAMSEPLTVPRRAELAEPITAAPDALRSGDLPPVPPSAPISDEPTDAARSVTSVLVVLDDLEVDDGPVVAEPTAVAGGVERPADEAARMTPEERRADLARINREVGRLYEDGRYADALAVGERTLAASGDLPVADPLRVALLANVAELHTKLGRFPDAERCHLEAMSAGVAAFGERSSNQAQIVGNVANFYLSRGEPAKAEPLHRQALAIRQALHTSEHPDVAQSQNSLAFTYASLGRPDLAEPLYLSAIAGYRHTVGEEHAELAKCLHNLGVLYGQRGDAARAEPLLARSLEIRRRVLGAAHPELAQGLTSLATLHTVVGDAPRAEPLQREALAIVERAFGPEHLEVAAACTNLAVSLRARGDLAAAAALLERGVAIRRRRLPPGHPEIARAEAELGALLGTPARS